MRIIGVGTSSIVGVCEARSICEANSEHAETSNFKNIVAKHFNKT